MHKKALLALRKKCYTGSMSVKHLSGLFIGILAVVLLGAWIFSYTKVAVAPVPVPSTSNIVVAVPQPGDAVTSPLVVSGEARGTWYFEASFPVHLIDANGRELAAVPAQAQGDWMTTEFVPFSATLSFETPTTETGTLIFKKDNPSGLPEHDAEVRVPVQFKKVTPGVLPYESGIRGMVTIGPTCPVERVPPDPLCADKPYEATLMILNTSGKQMATITSGKDGVFKISLPPGTYTIRPSESPSRMPYAGEQTVVVPAIGYTDVTIQYDSGIR